MHQFELIAAATHKQRDNDLGFFSMTRQLATSNTSDVTPNADCSFLIFDPCFVQDIVIMM